MKEYKVTIIDDSSASQEKFKEIFPTNIEIQPFTQYPFFYENEIKEFNPNLIIVDLQLDEDKGGNLAGLRIIRKLKEVDDLKNIPVVVVSKFVGEAFDYKKKAIESGADFVYKKIPFPKVKLFMDILENNNTR